MKEEALKLADELAFHQGELSMWTRNESCRMIRRLVEELDDKNYRILELTKRYKALTWNDKQGEPVASWLKMGLPQVPQTKPLSDEEIHKLAQGNFHAGLGISPLDFARAIEKEHGIK